MGMSVVWYGFSIPWYHGIGMELIYHPGMGTTEVPLNEDFTLPHLFPWESDGFR
jgi:hypothetical protein